MIELNRSVSLSQLQQRVLKLEQRFQERLETQAGGGARGAFCWDVPASVAAVQEDCAELLRRMGGFEDRLQARSGGEELNRKRFGRLEARVEQQVCTQELATSTHEAILKRQGSRLHGLGRASEDFATRVDAVEVALQLAAEAALQRAAEVSASAKSARSADEDGLPSTCASNTRSAIGMDSSLEASPSLSLRATGGGDDHSVASLDSGEEDRLGDNRLRGARAPSSAELCSEDGRRPSGLRDVDAQVLDELYIRVDLQERDLAELSSQLHAALAEAEASLGSRPLASGCDERPRDNVDRLICMYEDTRLAKRPPAPVEAERPRSLEGVEERLEDLVVDVSELYRRLVSGEEAGRKFQEEFACVLEAQMRGVSSALTSLGASVNGCAQGMDSGGRGDDP